MCHKNKFKKKKPFSFLFKLGRYWHDCYKRTTSLPRFDWLLTFYVFGCSKIELQRFTPLQCSFCIWFYNAICFSLLPVNTFLTQFSARTPGNLLYSIGFSIISLLPHNSFNISACVFADIIAYYNIKLSF